MVEKLADVWATRDLPVLIEVTRRIDAGIGARPNEVATALGISEEDLARSVDALARRGLVSELRGFTGHGWVQDVSAEAYFLTGLHPSSDDAVTALVEALRQAADQVTDPEERSRLRRLADGVLGISSDIIGAVLGAVTTKAIGM